MATLNRFTRMTSPDQTIEKAILNLAQINMEIRYQLTIDKIVEHRQAITISIKFGGVNKTNQIFSIKLNHQGKCPPDK